MMSLNISQLQTVTYQRKSTSCLLQYANSNRNQGRFNDVTIQSADTSIPANRMVLSCYCSFFDQIFASKTNNEVIDHSVVDIPDVDGKSLKLLIQYIYTGQICIDSNNVLDILAAAHYLELDKVKEVCFEVLEGCLTPDNCIIILLTAKQYKNFTLRDKAYKYISNNYGIVTKTPAFLNLDNDELFFIFYHLKTKFYVNEEALCRSLLSWTKQDEDSRKQHFHRRLIMFINVNKLSFLLKKDLLKESLIQENVEYYDLLNDKIKELKTKGTKIISIGGTRAKTKVKIVYSLNDKANEIYPDLPISLDYHRSIKTNNFVYVIGGKAGKKQVESSRAFRMNLNEKTLKWKEIGLMNVKRLCFGATVFDDAIVVCGGYNGAKCLSSAEAFYFSQNQWNDIETLNVSRSGNQLTTSGGCLYTMGGWDGSNCLSSMERLDGLNQSWKSVSSLQTPRNGFAVVSCYDVIYAIGGTSDGSNALKSVEKYDCAADKWMFSSEMNIERWGHSACVMQGKIYVIGGGNGQNVTVKEIECYDPSTDRWEIVAGIDAELLAHSLIAV